MMKMAFALLLQICLNLISRNYLKDRENCMRLISGLP